MCGICGIFGEAPEGAVTAMVAAMRHRGPDSSGHLAGRGFALGMARLAVLDLSAAANQPMSNEDRTVHLVYNGEVYNYRQERELLRKKGRHFVSDGDSEVVLRLYEAYGEAFLERLRGMFALAIVDRREGPGREKLLLARDGFGIKPLYYAEQGGRLLFASEIKALLASGLAAREVDNESLRLLLSLGSVPAPRSLLAGVRMLPPGSLLRVSPSGSSLTRYWSLGLDREPGLRRRPLAEQTERLAEVLWESVSLQSVSDVPLGAFLSGGVDSAYLVALMTRLRTTPLDTFSVGFTAEGAACDESREALATARHLGTRHHHVQVDGDMVRESACDIAWALDQPSVDGVNSYFVSKACAGTCTVALSGTGGDELFAGYPWFKAMADDPDSEGFLERYSRQYRIFGDAQAAWVLSPARRAVAGGGRTQADVLAGQDELSEAGPLERVTGLCLRGYTGNQLLRDIDAMSMRHSLEVRVPFLDPVVADLALSLPDAAKIAPRPGFPPGSYAASGVKRLLVEAARPLLPPDFHLRPKRGFMMPLDAWLRGPLGEILADTLEGETLKKRGLFDPQAVATIRRRFLAGEEGWPRPWLLLMIALWCQRVLDAPTGPAMAGGA